MRRPRRSLVLARPAARRRQDFPRGFSLVELVVVVAIIGALVALLLPAVQAARESARRSQCQNNLRQIGIGMALHVNAKGEFPIGCLGPSWTSKRHISWNVQILPFLELQELWHAFDKKRASFDPANKAVGSHVVEMFLCPSTGDSQLLSTTGAWRGTAFTDYGGLYGVEGTGRDVEVSFSEDAAEQDAAREIQTVREDSLGVLIYDVPVPPKLVSDGISKTACIAETALRRTSESEWINGENVFSQEQSTPINGIGLNNEIGSPHPGGASLAFCDARVDFVSESVDQNALNAMLSKAGGDQ
jgi:prepilin-type N-terminal cleavage/methylation domain-containing protein